MSSEDASVVMLRLPEGQGKPFPFPAQVEVPAHSGRAAHHDVTVDQWVERWCAQEDWRRPAKVNRSTEVDEDGVKRRVGRFVVEGLVGE